MIEKKLVKGNTVLYCRSPNPDGECKRLRFNNKALPVCSGVIPRKMPNSPLNKRQRAAENTKERERMVSDFLDRTRPNPEIRKDWVRDDQGNEYWKPAVLRARSGARCDAGETQKRTLYQTEDGADITICSPRVDVYNGESNENSYANVYKRAVATYGGPLPLGISRKKNDLLNYLNGNGFNVLAVPVVANDATDYTAVPNTYSRYDGEGPNRKRTAAYDTYRDRE